MRITFKDIFVSPPRRLEVSFYTSSIEKFLQARFVFDEFGLNLRHFSSSQEPYHEDYDLGQVSLLERAILEVKHRLGVNSIFFVEDTTVRIEALSDAHTDFPGLRVKEWFAQTTFKELDRDLRKSGRNRDAVVSSDIALHVPGLEHPIFFHGHTDGRVAATPPDFPRSEQHPWLSPNNFSGWFVPAGSERRLGEMSFEESLEHDFRVRSLTSLVERLEEYAAVLNLAGHSYSVRRSLPEIPNLRLFDEGLSLYIVIGRVCAGKTTFGQYASGRGDLRFIEASNVVRTIAREQSIEAPTPLFLAKELLRIKGEDIVARTIVGMYGDDLKKGAVITGFRTIQEVEFMRREFPECRVVLVDASERTRFERHLRRGRLEGVTTLEDFRQHDMEQWTFGLLAVAPDLADIKLENEGTIEEYHQQIESLLSGKYESASGISTARRTGASLRATRVFRCLKALEEFDEPATCSEIAKRTDTKVPEGNHDHVERISARHVNWVLKAFPELARRIDPKGDRIRYELLPAGRAYLNAIRSMVD